MDWTDLTNVLASVFKIKYGHGSLWRDPFFL